MMKKIFYLIGALSLSVHANEPMTKFDSQQYAMCHIQGQIAVSLLEKAEHMNKTLEEYLPLIPENQYPDDNIIELAQLAQHVQKAEHIINLGDVQALNDISYMLIGACYSKNSK